MEPILRSAQVLKQEGKGIAEYVRQHQALDREERAAWRDAKN